MPTWWERACAASFLAAPGRHAITGVVKGKPGCGVVKSQQPLPEVFGSAVKYFTP